LAKPNYYLGSLYCINPVRILSLFHIILQTMPRQLLQLDVVLCVSGFPFLPSILPSDPFCQRHISCEHVLFAERPEWPDVLFLPQYSTAPDVCNVLAVFQVIDLRCKNRGEEPMDSRTHGDDYKTQFRTLLCLVCTLSPCQLFINSFPLLASGKVIPLRNCRRHLVLTNALTITSPKTYQV